MIPRIPLFAPPAILCVVAVLGCGGNGGTTSTTPASPSPTVSAPTGVTAVAGDGLAVVSFTAPSANGGASISSYTATASPGASTASGTGSPITVTGLANGTPYTFTVRAINSVGIGAVSGPSMSVTPTAPQAVTPPVLSGSIVNLSGTYEQATSRLGSLDCTYKFATDPNDRWCYVPFGTHLTPGRVGRTMNYKVSAGAEVHAAAVATVVTIVADEHQDLYPGEYEIRTRPGTDSPYLVIYHHVRQLRVAVGGTLAVGDVLGLAGVHTSDRDHVGRTELQVLFYPDLSDKTRTESVCPQTLGTASFQSANDRALAAHNTANPGFGFAAVCTLERTQ